MTLLKEDLFVQIYNDDRALSKILGKVKKINKRQWEDMIKEKIKEKKDGWKVVDGLVRWKDLYPSRPRNSRNNDQNSSFMGHPGIDKTMELIT